MLMGHQVSKPGTWKTLSQKENFHFPKSGELELGSVQGQIQKAKYQNGSDLIHRVRSRGRVQKRDQDPRREQVPNRKGGHNAEVKSQPNTGNYKAHRKLCDPKFWALSSPGLREGFHCATILSVESCFCENSSIIVSPQLGLKQSLIYFYYFFFLASNSLLYLVSSIKSNDIP